MIQKKLTLSCVVLAAAGAFAQETDLARGAVDPLDLSIQRARFLQAAGVDSELNNPEFTANSQASDGFVRSFDKWENILKFDKNKSGSVDWFEAAAYRQALRKGILIQFDADKNNRLADKERELANQALAAGKLPGLTAEAPAVASPTAPPAPSRPQAPGRGFGGPDDEQRRQQFEQFRAEMTKKHDKNGDGELTGEERDAARDEAREFFRNQFNLQFDSNGDGQIDDAERQAIRTGFETRRYDANGDGQLDDTERATMERARAEGEQRRADFIKRYDKDGDGELNEDERRAAGEQERAAFIKEFDKDSDGELNEEERQAASQAARERFGRGDGSEGFGGRRGGFGRQRNP